MEGKKEKTLVDKKTPPFSVHMGNVVDVMMVISRKNDPNKRRVAHTQCHRSLA